MKKKQQMEELERKLGISNMTEEEIKTQIQIAIIDACENSSLSFYSKDEISNCYSVILELMKNQTSNVTRVEVVGKNGREFTKLIKTGKYIIMLQDENRTLKLFEEVE